MRHEATSLCQARRFRWLLAACFASAAIALCWYACRNSDTNFLPRTAPAHWIAYPSDQLGIIRPRIGIQALFQRSFVIAHSPGPATLRIAGFHHYSAWVNGISVPTPQRLGNNWKQPDAYDVSALLQAGTNEITVSVSNSNGPPALWLALEANNLKLITDKIWQCSYAEAAWQPAMFA